MRSVNYNIERKVSKIETITITNEEIVKITEDKKARLVFVEISASDDSANAEVFPVSINGDDYEILMSNNPHFAPNKPENEYREEDIWYMVDLIRSRNSSLE